MIRRPPRSTRTDTLFPYTTLFRSAMCGASAKDAPCVDEVALPVFEMDAGDDHAAAAGRRVYRFVIAEIDRDVIDAVSGEAVEQQIARFGVVDVDLAAVGVLLTRGTWQLHAGQAINVLHQAD